MDNTPSPISWSPYCHTSLQEDRSIRIHAKLSGIKEAPAGLPSTMVLTGDIIAPESPALPALPPDDFWSETEWAVFNSILDTIVPAVVSKSSLSDKEGQLAIPDGEFSAVMARARASTLESQDEVALRAFMEDKVSTHPAVREVSLRIAARLSDVQKDGLKRLLKLMSSVVLLFT